MNKIDIPDDKVEETVISNVTLVTTLHQISHSMTNMAEKVKSGPEYGGPFMDAVDPEVREKFSEAAHAMGAASHELFTALAKVLTEWMDADVERTMEDRL